MVTTFASPLSFVGATARIWNSTTAVNPRWLRLLFVWGFVVPIVLPVVYSFLVMWYTVIFGLFGIFVIPWRLHRRSERKKMTLLAGMAVMMAARERNHND